jgi:ribonuclease P protein component
MLPDAQRLKANRDFRLIYARGRSYADRVAVLHVLRRTGNRGSDVMGRRIGFVVSKKQGGAVIRNRIKRRLREALRERLSEIRDEPIDMILVGRSPAGTASWSEIQGSIEELLRRSNLLQGRPESGARSPSDAESGQQVN